MNLMKQWISSRFHSLFILYFIANIFLLLNYSGVYWDDWTLVNQDPASILNIYSQTGFWWMGYFHVYLQSIGNGIYVYRLIGFFSYFFSGIFLYYILDKLNYFNKRTLYILVLLFLLAPVNDARVALINTPAILTVFLFYFAFFLLALYMDSNKKIYNRIIILSIFFITFCLESLLVFYAVVLVYILIKTYQQNLALKKSTILKIFITRYLDFICLPLFFFGIKQFFFQPHGLYTGYNSLHFDVINLLSLLGQSFYTSLYQPLKQAISSLYYFFYFMPLIFILVLVIFKKEDFFESNTKISIVTRTSFLICGVLLFLIAVFPYCAVGKLPHLDNWASRNQILVPLGMSFLLYWLIMESALLNKRLANGLLYLVVTSFIVQNLYNHYLYNIDWFYQKSLIAQFKKSDVFKNNTTFIATDELEREVWVHKRGLVFYELGGLFKQAFHEDTRLLVHDISAIKLFSEYSKYPQYNFSHWVPEKPVTIKLQKNNDFELTLKKQFGLFYNYIFNTASFEQNIKNLSKVVTNG
ncbi:MAG TPA: hypothetical protein PK657_04820 [Legionella sp.]|nr:hypothetical protein [Legionella sp.]